MVLIAMLCVAGGVWAQETLTVYDGGAQNSNIPFYGLYADYGTRSQFIIPATVLDEMIGGSISKLTFYSSTESTIFDEEVTVYVKEVSFSSFESSTLVDWTTMQEVYKGTLTVSGNQMEIEFNSPFDYEGENLLIGFQVTDWGSACPSIKWYGENQAEGNYTAMYNNANSSHVWGNTPSLVTFIPKTTITYEPAAAGDCDKPDALTANGEPTDEEFSFNIEGGSGVYNIQIKVGDSEWTDYDYEVEETTINLEGLATNTTYIVRVQSVCDMINPETGKAYTSSWKTLTFTTKDPDAAPTNLQVSDITTSSATLTWTPGYLETTWTVKYKKASDEEWTETTVSGTPTITLTGLAQLTVYNVQVYNGENFVSTSFTTIYDALSLPYAESFENDIDAWTLVDCTSGTGVGTMGGGHDGSKSFMFKYNTNPPQFLISPKFEGAATPMAVSFWYKIYSTNYPETFQVGYSTTTIDVNAFTWEDEVTATNNNEWLQYETTFPAGTKYVAIRYNSNDMYYLFVDDFRFEASDGFVKPTDLAVSEIGSHSVVLSWTEKVEATAWVVAYKTGDAAFTEVNATEKPFTLTGLTPETTYTAKVRQAGETDKWSDAITFTTGIANPAPKALAAKNILATTAEISWKADEYATGAVLEYAIAEGASLSFAEYKYDNGTMASGIGLGGGAFQWGVMFPAGSYTGNTLTKVSVYDTQAMTGSVTIYNDGTTAPAKAVATVPVTLTGVNDFIDIEVNATIDPSKNVWVIFNNASGASYPAACSVDDLDDANGRWVELDGDWYDMANVGISERCFMIRAEIGTIDTSSLTWTTVADATSPCQLTGLTPSTNYMVRVKSLYAENVESAWTTTSFTTFGLDAVPVNLQTTDVASTSATLNWEGEQDDYKLRYRSAGIPDPSAPVTIILEAHDVWGDGSGYQLLLDADANAYGTLWNAQHYIFVNGEQYSDGDLSEDYYNEFEYKLPTEADGSLSTTNVMVDGTVTITIPAGTYDFAILNPTPGDRFYVAGDNGEVGGTEDDFVFEPGMTYHFTMGSFGNGDGAALEITSSWSDWTEVNDIADTSYELTSLTPDTNYEWQVQGIYGGEPTEWSKAASFTTLPSITLADTEDNSATITEYDDKKADVTLTRTLNAGGWNTFCVPFNLDIPDGWTVKELTGTELNGTTLTLNFDDATSIEAGKPYLVQVNDKVENPTFCGVTIAEGTTTTETTYANFVPVMNPTLLTGGDESVLFVTGGNNLTYPAADGNINGFRAYFKLNVSSEVRAFSMDFGDSEATGIQEMENEEWRMKNGGVYDLQGRKIQHPELVPGIYIVNGKKVIIK